MKIGWVLRRVTLKGVMRAGNVKMFVSLASLGMLVMVFFCAREARGQTTRPSGPNIVGPYRADPKADGRFYVVERFELEYLKHRKGEPPLSEVMQMEVELGRAQDGYVRPRPGLPTVRFRLGNASRQILDRYYTSALDEIDKQIVRWFNSKGVVGVFVAPDSNDLDLETGKDSRVPNRRALKINILIGVVEELRTVASGERFPVGDRVNNPAHQKIRDNSPVKPESQGGPSLLRKDLLDDYIFRLNRIPGRRVDLAMSASPQPGGVSVDYLVAEAKPWTVYGQVSNTGTEQTSKWRERVGFILNEATRHQDTLSIDYITAGGADSQSVVASYEAPVYSFDRLRWKVYGTWSEFTASDVGFSQEQFNGDEWMVGGELIANFYQRRELFLDAIGGMKYRSINVTNETAATKGEGKFFEPYLGLRVERATDEMTTVGEAQLMFGFSSSVKTTSAVATANPTDGLGRVGADDNFILLQGNVTHSFFLEPMLWERGRFHSLAHEIALSGRFQYSFGYRLIPQEEEVVGGLYTVRGYPESAVAGDTVFIGSAEYRFHYPRSMRPREAKSTMFGQPFRWAPEASYGKADWDLIFKGFLDLGKTIQTDRLPFENNDTLIGAGVGVELQFKQNMTIRADWGFALHSIDDPKVDTGDNRLHFVFTVLY